MLTCLLPSSRRRNAVYCYPGLANQTGCNPRAANSCMIGAKLQSRDHREKKEMLAGMRCFDGKCFGLRWCANRFRVWTENRGWEGGRLGRDKWRERWIAKDHARILSLVRTAHPSEAVHCASQMPVNLSHHSVQHSSLYFTAPLDHSGHTSCETAACARWCPIDLLFWKIHINMPNSCRIANPWL